MVAVVFMETLCFCLNKPVRQVVTTLTFAHTMARLIYIVINGGLDKMDEGLQTTFSNVFSSKKCLVFWFKFHWFIPHGPIDIRSALVQVMGWCWNKQQTSTWTNDRQSPWQYTGLRAAASWYMEAGTKWPRQHFQQIHLFKEKYLTHWGRDKMAAIFQTTFSNAFSWMKMLKFLLRFHWSLFPRVQSTIFHHWFR